MRILLTGAAGQVGTAFIEAAKDHDILPLDRAALDLTDLAAIPRVVERARPDAILHAAAVTNVDLCEREPALARVVNAEATHALARAARAVGARMAYISTDYVFDGERGSYREEDAPAPVQVYGATKLEGERLAQAALPSVLIARTSVVFAARTKNFVTWVADELRAGRRIRIVKDQRQNPTLANDLARQIVALLEARAEGVYHAAGASALSRMDAARAIARELGLDAALIDEVPASAMTWAARRPRDSTLVVDKVARLRQPLAFAEALRELKARM